MLLLLLEGLSRPLLVLYTLQNLEVLLAPNVQMVPSESASQWTFEIIVFLSEQQSQAYNAFSLALALCQLEWQQEFVLPHHLLPLHLCLPCAAFTLTSP